MPAPVIKIRKPSDNNQGFTETPSGCSPVFKIREISDSNQGFTEPLGMLSSASWVRRPVRSPGERGRYSVDCLCGHTNFFLLHVCQELLALHEL